jgi:co-chaperonin GroES (HSP10)
MAEMNVKPLPGNMIVKLESLYIDTLLIRIPERFKKAPRLVGRITAISMRLEDHRTLGTELVVGDRIIVTPLGGRYLETNTWIYPISVVRKDERGKKYRDSGVLAIVPDEVDLSASAGEIPRCQFCGEVNGSKQNMILWQGICPRCGRNRHGEKPDTSAKVTDAEIERFKRAV